MEPIVRVGVACFVWKDGKFLTLQRQGAHGAGSWSIPGGHLELNESWEECAAREVLEETNVEVNDIKFLAATNDIFTKENKHYVTIWMEGSWGVASRLLLSQINALHLVGIHLKTCRNHFFYPGDNSSRLSQSFLRNCYT